MKKFSNFVIKARYFIFAILMLLFVGSILLIPKVTINKDMTKYLPDGSSMKAGISIIDEEFPGTLDQKDIKVMFKNLEEDEKLEVYEKLKLIENVTKVTYDDSENYNKGFYTLYVLSSDFKYKSKEEIKIEKDIKEEFKDMDVIVQHVMYATTTIPTWVLIVAFSALTIILIIMCASWIDPILFLFTIGIAVCLNFGTNFFLPSVSETTFSLSAILQLVLSMDYSIILMNSYRQEREENEDVLPIDAMKHAFSKAFPSIIGSGLTTIIGLLMLIFMQFKLGMDLGIVMAKGVALSMLCVLTILPTLIIWSDKLIFKLTKRQLHVHMRKVVRYEFRHKFQILTLFLIVFFGAIIFQGSTKVTFAEVKNDKIGDVFTPTNNAIIVYDNNDEENIKDLMQILNRDKDINMALSYQTTLALPMKANEFNEAIKVMVPNVKIPEKITKMLYYDYFNKNDKDTKLTISNVYNLLVDEIIIDPDFTNLIPEDIKEKILMVKPFINTGLLTKPLTAKEMSSIINIDEKQLDLLYSMVYAINRNQYIMPSFELYEVVDHLKNNILPNPLLSPFLPSGTSEKLTFLEQISNVEFINTPLNGSKISEILTLPKELVDNILMYKFGTSTTPISLINFLTFTVNEFIPNPAFSSLFTKEQVEALNSLYRLVDNVNSKHKFTYKEMTKLLFTNSTFKDETMVKVLYVYKAYLINPSNYICSIQELLSFVSSYGALIPSFDQIIKPEDFKLIKFGSKLVNNIVNDKEFSPVEMCEFFKEVEPSLNTNYFEIGFLLYNATHRYNLNYKMSMEEVINYLANDLINDERFSLLINDEMKLMIKNGQKMLNDNKKQLVGTNHSLIVLDLKVSDESIATTEFFERLEKMCSENLTKDYHFVGNSAMNVEMEKGFNKDLTLITILTALAIFIIVAITFRSLLIPLILVSIVQCGVYMTVCISGVLSHSIYYLALLIVQCILMGATIDYAIVFTNYYKNNRKTMEIGPAVDDAYTKSLHTIMTSGLIIVLVTGLIGLSPADPAIGQICLTLSFGTLCAILLILFILPGLIMVFDKYIIKENKAFTFKRKKKVKKEETLE